MNRKVYDSEIKVLDIIWANEPVSAKDIALKAETAVGWNKNTTYTVVKKVEAKGYIRRQDPGFICTSLISKDDVRRSETQHLVDRLFGGSKKALFAFLLEDESLTKDDIEELKELVKSR